MKLLSRVARVFIIVQLIGDTIAAAAAAAVADSEIDCTPDRYQRIYIEDPTDYPKIYDLLTSYIAFPELALTVTELQFLPHKFRDGSLKCCPKLSVAEEGIVESVRAAIHNVTLPLYANYEVFTQVVAERLPLLARELRDQYVANLMWMQSEVVEQRKEIFDKVKVYPGLKCQFGILAKRRDHDFIYHATALLLLLCPNVERLIYRDNRELDNVVEDILKSNNYDSLSMSSNKSSYLAKLKHVALLPTDDIMFGDERFYIAMDILELIRMFHRLPNIESVSAGGLGIPRGEYLDVFPAGTSNIKKITISHSQLDSSVIEALARMPKALEEFTMTTGGRSLPGGGTLPTQVKWLGKALQCQKSSLVKLDLDLGTDITDDELAWLPDDRDPECETENYRRRVPDFSDEEWRDFKSRARKIDDQEAQGPLFAMDLHSDREYGKTIGPLHNFEHLTHLSTGAEFLFSRCYCQFGCPEGTSLDVPFRLVDALPPNLKYLMIRGYIKGRHPEVDEHFAEFLKLSSERFPALEEIHGIDELVPGAEHVDNPDRDTHLLWEPEDTNNFGWLEVEQQSPIQCANGLKSNPQKTRSGTTAHDEL